MLLPFETDAGSGPRATLGVIVLEADETLEPEFARLLTLDGVALYHNRIPMAPQIRPDTLAQMESEIPDVVAQFPTSAGFDVIGFGCTSASSVIGSDAVARAVQQVIPEAQVTNPLAALIAAGRALGVTRLGFVSPYEPRVSLTMRTRLAEAGFDIVSFGSFGEEDDRVVGRITPDAIRTGVETVVAAAPEDTPCEAIIIACTNLRALGVIEDLESQMGIPVLSSNQALGWHMLRLAGVTDLVPGAGRLLRTGL